TLPLAMVRPEIVTPVFLIVWKTRWVLLPLTVTLAAPGPWIVRFFVTASSPLVSVMVPLTAAGKGMVSPGGAAAIWARSEPAPLSLRLVTVRVLGTVRSSSASRRGRTGRDRRAVGRGGRKR